MSRTDAPESRGGFLGRWSARKRAAREVDEGESAAPETAAPAPDEAAPPALSEEEAAELTDAEVLERLALPDPASLDHGADFRAFLRAGVPKRLQRLALRRLWAVSPGGAALDGLVDYAEDYTDAAVAVASLDTTYEVGKGLRAHVEALARGDAPAEDAAGEEGAAVEGAAVEGEDAPPEAGENAPGAEKDESATPQLAAEPGADPRPSDAALPRETPSAEGGKPRKMAFRFKAD